MQSDLMCFVGIDVAKAHLDVAVRPTGEGQRFAVEMLDKLVAFVAKSNAKLVVMEALGKLAKTDTIDAGVLAHFAAAIRPAPRPLPDEQTQELEALVMGRRQLMEMLVAEQCRLSATRSKSMQESLKLHMDWLKNQIKDVDKDITKAVRESAIWNEKAELQQSVPGVGRVLSSTVIATLPELGTLDRKQMAALVWVAPFNRDSGNQKSKRSI